MNECGQLCSVGEHPRITARWLLLGLLALARGCQFITEQPSSSLMTICSYVRFLALIIRPHFWDHVRLPGAQWFPHRHLYH